MKYTCPAFIELRTHYSFVYSHLQYGAEICGNVCSKKYTKQNFKEFRMTINATVTLKVNLDDKYQCVNVLKIGKIEFL